MNMITKKWEGMKYPQWGGTRENNPFALQSRKKERDNGHDKNWPSIFETAQDVSWILPSGVQIPTAYYYNLIF